METPDTVVGIQDPYLNRFELWGKTGRLYGTGDTVPAVGMTANYSVQLPGPEDARKIFLQVQDAKITNVMALQPLGDKSVFDPRGGYLGRGGQELEPIKMVVEKPVDIITAVEQMQDTSPPKEDDRQKPAKDRTLGELLSDFKENQSVLPDTLTHGMHLRLDFEMEVELPDDLTEAEAERICSFIQSIPMVEDKDEEWSSG